MIYVTHDQVEAMTLADRIVVLQAGRIEQIARALGDIRPSQLSDPKLFDFLALGKRGDGALPDTHAWLGGDAASPPDA